MTDTEHSILVDSKMRPKRKLLDDLRRKKRPSKESSAEVTLPGPIKHTPLVVDLTAIPNDRKSAICLENSSDCVNDSIVIISENGEEETVKAIPRSAKGKKHDDSIEICYEKFLDDFGDNSQKRKKRKKSSKFPPPVGTDSSSSDCSTVCENVSPIIVGDISCTVTSTTDDVIFIDASQKSAEEDVVVLDSAEETSSPENSGKAKERKKKRKKKVTPLLENTSSGASAVSSSIPTVILDKIGDQNKRCRYQSPLVSIKTKEVDKSLGHNVNGANMYNPNCVKKTGLRPVIIDGSNVAFGHGKTCFSVRGLIICVQYFLKRGHSVVAFMPLFRRNEVTQEERNILDSYEKKGQVVFTPSRYLHGRCISPYDDRYIVQCAAELAGVIVSNDNYRDLVYENPAWSETINKRLLMFTWVGDILMFPDDPNGRHGPRLEEFLRFP